MSKRLIRAGVLLAGALWMGVLPGAPQSIFRKAPPDVEEALRARVNEFYSLFQQAKFRQAEALVAEESRDLFYAAQKAPVRGFRVESIDFADDFKSAKVLVACLSVTPRTASSGVYVPTSGLWKLLDGKWYLLIEKRVTTPFGPMTFEDPSKYKPEPFQRPTAETVIAGAFRIDPRTLLFPREGEGPFGRTITITNNMPGPITVEVQNPQLPGLALILSAKTIQPKGFVHLQAYYTPSVGKLRGTREFSITIQPINQTATIELKFE